jgi:hypothetical protein
MDESRDDAPMPRTQEAPQTIPAETPKRTREEVNYLAGPQSRGFEARHFFRVASEYLRALRALHFAGPCATVFGSARFPEGHPHYEASRAVGSELVKAGFTVMTGGGPGLMEAANRGAKESGGSSIGCNIILQHEQAANAYLDRVVTFRYFFIRKVMLVKYSFGFVAMPGGFGTFDEVFETLTLIQTGKIKDFPVVLFGRAYWEPFLAYMRATLLGAHTIDAEDLDRVSITDSPNEAAALIRDAAMRKFGLRYSVPLHRRKWWLLER